MIPLESYTTFTPHKRPKAPFPTRAQPPRASTSAIPFSPSLATLLPPELLSSIFQLARPALLPPLQGPHTTQQLEERTAFSQLALVHSSWTSVAQRELARVVVVRSHEQKRKLVEALEGGWIHEDAVEELVWEIKEVESGHEGGLGKRDDDNDATNALHTILEGCKTRLGTIRLRGFGDKQFLSTTVWSEVDLDAVTTLEYSPIDSSSPPSTKAVCAWLRSLPNLKHLILAPNSRSLAPLECLSTLAESPFASSNPSRSTSDEDLPSLAAFSDLLPRANLETFTLCAIAISSPTLLALLTSSFISLTSLTLTSTLIVGPPQALVLTLRALIPQLTRLAIEDRLSNPLPAQAANANIGQGGAVPAIRAQALELPINDYWSLLNDGKELKELSLFGELVFSRSRVEQQEPWEIPSQGLELLSLGSRGTVEGEDLVWWLDRVLVLISGRVEQEEEEEEEEKTSSTVAEQQAESEESPPSQADDLPPSLSALGKQVKVKKRKNGRRVTWSTSRSSVNSLPSSSSSTFAATSPRAASSSQGPSSPFQRLCLWTTETHLRNDERISTKVKDICRFGVEVVWFEMRVVILDSLELTKELRCEMFNG